MLAHFCQLRRWENAQNKSNPALGADWDDDFVTLMLLEPIRRFSKVMLLSGNHLLDCGVEQV